MLQPPLHAPKPPASVSSIDFPAESADSSSAGSASISSAGNHQRPPVTIRPPPPHLPFRRISFPTPVSLLQRDSVVSVASFDSLLEEGNEAGPGIIQAIKASSDHYTRVHKASFTSSSTALSPSSSSRIGDARRRSIESPRRDREREGGKQRGKHKGRASEANASSSSHAPSPSNYVSTKSREAREAKRRKIVREFYDTEKSYVDGLDFIYHHFLSPLISSFETPDPILARTSLTNLFSNFIDIWNLHKSFFDALTDHLTPMFIVSSDADHRPSSTPSSSAAAANNLAHDPAPSTNLTTQPSAAPAPPPPPPLSPVLLSHFPYLSLYTPFITAFPSILSTLSDLTTPPTFSNSNPNYSKPFTEFLAKQEADLQCGRLKFRDWMLTIVQRCPRYLLLLKDLRGCTEPMGEEDERDGEYEKLGSVLDLVAKITNSLNTSLQNHAQTLSLISLQRSTSNLPFQLVVPGRTLLKRGPLCQIERSEPARDREFLVFSDCMVWLSRSGDETDWMWGKMMIGNSFSNLSSSSVAENLDASRIYGPGGRNRSMSDAHLPLPSTIQRNGGGSGVAVDQSRSTPPSPQRKRFPFRAQSPMPTPLAKRHSAASSFGSGCGSGSGADDKWAYKGRLELVDIEVVVASEWGGEQRRFEVLSPEGSFALYAATEHDRDDWVSTIRQAKAQILVSLNVRNPNSTLTSSTSANHVRRSLQALPFPLSDNRLATEHEGGGGDAGGGRKRKGKGNLQDSHAKMERRAGVEHWVPAIWIPDEKTKECMRCGQPFGWRRRRHHCRLCGRCVCASCSEKTFYIADLSAKDGSSKPARACNMCYEAVFPILEEEASEREVEAGGGQRRPHNKSVSKGWDEGEDSGPEGNAKDTITSLSNFSAWMSMPSLPNSIADSVPQALMGSEFERGVEGILSRTSSEHGVVGEVRRARVRLRSQNSRPMSYLQGFEDSRGPSTASGTGAPTSPNNLRSPHSNYSENTSGVQQRRESTVRKRKRFSLPAIAIQPMNVTARTILAGGGTDGPSPSSPTRIVAGSRDAESGSGHASGGKDAAKRALSRLSLVLSGRNQSVTTSVNDITRGSGETVEVEGGMGMAGSAVNNTTADIGGDEGRRQDRQGGVEKSLVMGKLSELLKDSKARS